MWVEEMITLKLVDFTWQHKGSGEETNWHLIILQNLALNKKKDLAPWKQVQVFNTNVYILYLPRQYYLPSKTAD